MVDDPFVKLLFSDALEFAIILSGHCPLISIISLEIWVVFENERVINT